MWGNLNWLKRTAWKFWNVKFSSSLSTGRLYRSNVLQLSVSDVYTAGTLDTGEHGFVPSLRNTPQPVTMDNTELLNMSLY
ncbi:MAG TPA: hypothetical protein VKA08_09020 [Balneolales bacterium]|nr:hypothetical protein [Balneolales bacterium]